MSVACKSAAVSPLITKVTAVPHLECVTSHAIWCCRWCACTCVCVCHRTLFAIQCRRIRCSFRDTMHAGKSTRFAYDRYHSCTFRSPFFSLFLNPERGRLRPLVLTLLSLLPFALLAIICHASLPAHLGTPVLSLATHPIAKRFYQQARPTHTHTLCS